MCHCRRFQGSVLLPLALLGASPWAAQASSPPDAPALTVERMFAAPELSGQALRNPRFSPDGGKVIMSMAKDGNSDIFAMDLRSRSVQRLTNHPSIDTGPSFAPDGKRVVFESDRGGTQQLYTMSADGSNQQRISFGQGRYGNPVWSPRGDLIAFTRIYQGKFYIGVIKPDGSGERLITSAYHVEGPTWSPNGRVLSYFKETPMGSGGQQTAKLYTIDLTGFNERQLQTPADGSDPAWSPVNP